VPGFFVENFGCRATQADGAALERQFEERGLVRADSPKQAAVVILNTCTVTSGADQDARAAIRRVRRQNPGARIVVTGCYAQRAPQELADLPGVDLVVGNSHKHQLAEIALGSGQGSDRISRGDRSRGGTPSDAVSSDSDWRSDLGRDDSPDSGPAQCSDQEQRGDSAQRSDSGRRNDSGQRSDQGWRSASSAANQGAFKEGASAPEVPAFVPLSALTTSQRPTTTDHRPIFVSDIFAHTELLAAPVFDAANERTRPNLKIQDGCDNRCSFCVIPYVRGQSRSLTTDRIIQEVNTLVTAGYREVVLSGINLGRWGRDLGAGLQASGASQTPPQTADFRPQPSDLTDHCSTAHVGTDALVRPGEQSSPAPSPAGYRNSKAEHLTPDARNLAPAFPRSEVQGPRSDLGLTPDARGLTPSLPGLIRAILNETSLEKLRISSVEPMDWSDDLIDLVATSPRIAKHAHVPMQSGSDAVLRRMRRKYRPWHYREKIEKIRAAMPTAAIGADVMVGFPGETDAEFEATRQMIEGLPFTYLHVFTYSARPGTPAAEMKNQVPVHVARERNRILRELASEKKLAFMRSFIGKTVEAITLNVVGSDSEGEFTEALTDNYLKLRLHGRHEANRWQTAMVKKVATGSLVGSVRHGQ